MRNRIAVSGLIVVMTLAAATADDQGDKSKSTSKRAAAQRELEPFNDWVGTWRGVGQPRRGSNKGAWVEQADWSWKIDREAVGLHIEISDGKLMRGGLLTYDSAEKKFRFAATLPDGKSRSYIGERAEEGKLVLLSPGEDGSQAQRLTFQMRHPDRMLALVEAKSGPVASYSRVAEIGYTRKGGSFAAAADAGPKCIVTGGRGTTSIEYRGKTYYVCCSGCKQAFEDDPEGILAEAAERVKREAADRKK